MAVDGNATPQVLMVFFPFHDIYLETLILNKVNLKFIWTVHHLDS